MASAGVHLSQNIKELLIWPNVKVMIINHISCLNQPSVSRRSVTAKDTLLNNTWRTDVVPVIAPRIPRYFQFSTGTS